MRPRLGVLGGGYVGLAVAVGFAERGFSVVLVESSPARFEALTKSSFFSSEQELVEAFQQVRENGSLQIYSDVSSLDQIPFLFVCVGTPPRQDGQTDLNQLWTSVEEAAPYLPPNGCFIIKSTVPVGTADQVQAWFDERNRSVEVVSYPEFLREGKTLEDFRQPSRVILGGDANHEGLQLLRKILAEHALPILVTTRKNAELIKYAANAFLATKISFINQMAQLSEELGTDVQTIARGIGMDPRIGQAFLGAGIGFGGPCLPKDMLSLIQQAKQKGKETPLFHAVLQVNDQQQEWMVEKARISLGSLAGKQIAVWGVSFKGGTEDIRDSAAIPVMESLLKEQAVLRIHDPFGLHSLKQKWRSDGTEASYESQVEYCQDKWKAVEQADVLLILTDWQEYKEADLFMLKRSLAQPMVIDGRNLFPLSLMRDCGFKYISVGRKV